MRERKRCFEFYSFYDHAGIAAHLEKMAGKGWLLQKITRGGWIYERIEPQRLRFTISYYAKASALDPKPSEESPLLGQEPGAYHYYLLLFEDRMVQIGLRMEPTSAQKAIVGEKLAGVWRETDKGWIERSDR